MEPESTSRLCFWPLSNRNLLGWPGDITLGTGSWRLRLWGSRLGRGEGQLRGVVQDLPFLRRELAEAPGLDLPLAHLRRHRPQGLDGISHRLAPIGRQTLELGVRRPELLFLLRRQMLPGLHALQDLLLPFRRQAVEALKSLLEFLLTLRWKPAKIPVILQGLPLLFERLIAVLIQPLTGMMTFGGRLIRSGLRFPRRLGRRTGLRLRAGLRFRTRRRTGLSLAIRTRRGRLVVPVILGQQVRGKQGHSRQRQHYASGGDPFSDLCSCSHLSPEIVQSSPTVQSLAKLRIRVHILLHLQIVEQAAFSIWIRVR